ncbi:MAG: hypothetical protein FWE30_08610, partial [Bacteroidales bacterium]|nr:hypothetical protein [Bacteroidales bacterium]
MRKKMFRYSLACLFILFGWGFAQAQSQAPSQSQPQSQSSTLRAVLLDSLSREPLQYVTVAVYEGGSETPSKFAISNREGLVEILGIPRGRHTVKIDIMGYVSQSREINFTAREPVVDLGNVLLKEDAQMLDAAVVTAMSNPIVVRQDTIQYNAAAFRTSDNDMLEELLKKLPGVEVDKDGKITVNGREISRVVIDGKTFFSDDPTIATRNLPARIVDRVNVVNRRSEQAQFTGIDDGNDEFVLDLSIRPGMMNGWFGNLMAGYGTEDRYQAQGMVGRFQGGDQLAFIGNWNNTNNRGFADAMAGSMQGMRGGGPGGGGGGGGGVRFGGNTFNFGGSGIMTSWNAGVNMNTELLDKKLKVGGNYFYGGSEAKRESNTLRQNFLPDSSFYYAQEANSINRTESHRIGMEFDYSINERSSILFRPNGNIGYGRFDENSQYSSTGLQGTKINDGWSKSFGESQSKGTGGELLLRHRFAKPGNTMSLSINYNLSESSIDGYNRSETNVYGVRERKDTID